MFLCYKCQKVKPEGFQLNLYKLEYPYHDFWMRLDLVADYNENSKVTTNTKQPTVETVVSNTSISGSKPLPILNFKDYFSNQSH